MNSALLVVALTDSLCRGFQLRLGMGSAGDDAVCHWAILDMIAKVISDRHSATEESGK